MSVSTCPKCHLSVTLPSQSDPTAWVRCPLCKSTYFLQEALHYLPPELEIVPDHAESLAAIAPAAIAPAAAEAAVASAATFDPLAEIGEHIGPPEQSEQPVTTGAESEWGELPADALHAAEEAISAEDMEQEPQENDEIPEDWFNPAAAETATQHDDNMAIDLDMGMEMAPAEAPVVSQEVQHSMAKASVAVAAKPIKRKPKPEGGALGKLIGALITIPLAAVIVQALLWWAFGQDPLKLGPKVADVMPFVVPEAFRGTKKTPIAATNPTPKNTDVAATGNPTPSPMPDDPMPDPDLMPTPNPQPQPEPFDLKPTPIDDPPIKPVPKGKGMGVNTVAAVKLEELGLALKDADQQSKTIVGSPEADRGKLRVPYLKAVYKLAEKVTLADPDAAQLPRSQKLSAARDVMLRSISGGEQDATELADFGGFGAAWIRSSFRGNEIGVVLVGNVKSVEMRGGLMATRISLAGKLKENQQREYIVISHERLPDVQVGQPIMIPGIIIDKPKTSIDEFTGDEDVVVFATTAFDLPVKEPLAETLKEPAVAPLPPMDPPKADPLPPAGDPLPAP